MLPAASMEDETCRISLHQHIAAAQPASAIRTIKATDFSIAAIIGSANSKPAPSPDAVKPLPLFNFGESLLPNDFQQWLTAN